ncbi:hypothetical protein [Enterovibrio paralichthyis]|uniref:hypothetical protein n=1 Tax=Enterovibrio paralichthyis TaxID=2853805 RepID=UPI001C4916E9|nr:hypothetical protein [Enterovibrio paralichthyis]MBV7300229.1 hypothetical protein [Enterovibrio paralichthyis]
MSSFEEAVQKTLTMLNHRIKELSDRDILTDEQQEYINELIEERDQLFTELKGQLQ